jgi:uncharacterized protein with GYD domain
MPKFLVEATYTADGFKGLQKDKASGRLAAVSQAAQAVGGAVESFHFAFGETDVIVILDMPNATAAAALAAAISASGLVRLHTTPLLTVAEMDEALSAGATYKAPGR